MLVHRPPSPPQFDFILIYPFNEKQSDNSRVCLPQDLLEEASSYEQTFSPRKAVRNGGIYLDRYK